MNYPCSTGEAARLLGITELRLADLVRRGRVSPAPIVSAGRRQWYSDNIDQAARALGVVVGEERETGALGGLSGQHPSQGRCNSTTTRTAGVQLGKGA